MLRAGFSLALVVLIMASCGGDRPSLADYAAEAGDLVGQLRARLQEVDDEWESGPPSAERAERFWRDRLEARAAFTDGLRALEPPAELAEVHAAYLDLFDRLNDAERVVAAGVLASETVTDHWAWWDTEEGRAAKFLDHQSVAACYSAQEYLDSTHGRSHLADSPWVPAEMSEVARVSLGCEDFRP